MSPKILANDFGKFFEQKIEKIYKTLDMHSARPCGPDVANEELAVHAPRTAFSMPLTQPAGTSLFTSFKPVSEEDARALITKVLSCLEVAFKNFCPISNLPFVSKLSE